MANTHRTFLENVFSHYSKGETEEFFRCFDPHVKWMIHGEHDLAGEYKTLSAVRATYALYMTFLRDKPKHLLKHLVVEGTKACALLVDEVVSKDNRNHLVYYTFFLELSKTGDSIIAVDNYVDSLQINALVKASGKSRLSA